MSDFITVVLVAFGCYLFYLVRKFYRDPIEGTITVMKILRAIRWIISGFVGLIYFILPIDIVPDIIIPFGWIDDFAVFLTAHTIIKWLTFPHRVERALNRIGERINRRRY